ncbi:MAG TPA: maleylacetoacetate isomerase, partial [Steroidobacteraceae bacterium]|nr:maleylacetoacetate isomerase [Steroidobacteraceae bacterium]
GVMQLSEEQVNRWLAEWIGRGMATLEMRLAQDAATGRFCHGDEPTLADACLVPQCYASARFGVNIAAYPTIARIQAACQDLPAFARAAPDRQPDAPG